MTVQQQAGTENEKAYGYQGAEGAWTITKDEFEGHKGFSSDLPSCAGSWREIPINFTYTFDANGDVTGTQTYTRKTFPSTGYTGWIGGAVGQDGKIYCGRHSERGFLIIDPDVGKAYTWGAPGAQQNQQESGMVSHPNGKIYTCPASGGGIYELDPLNKTYYRWYPGFSTGFDVGETVGGSIYAVQKFCNGVVAPNNNCIYYIPDGADKILKVDPSTRTQTEIGTACPYQGFEPTSTNYYTVNLTGRHKYIQGVLGKDGNIYMIGNTANNPRISKIDPRTDTVTWNHVEYSGNLYAYNVGQAGVIADAVGNDLQRYWSSAVAGPDGLIYLIPDQYPWIYTYDPTASGADRLVPQMGSTTTVNGNNMQVAAVGTVNYTGSGSFANDDQKTCGAVVGADGNIYCGPEKTGAKILKIYTGRNKYNVGVNPSGANPVNYGWEFIDLEGWTGSYDGFHSAVLAPNGHMYLVPGDTKSSPAPQGVVEVHLGTASKPAPWTYGPYITAK